MHSSRMRTARSPSMHCAMGCLLLGEGCLLLGEGCLLLWGSGPGGCLVLGGLLSQHALRHTPL